MILGVGIDMVDIRRLEPLLNEQFIARIFTPEERTQCDARKERAACYAKRFAAKEAVAKALGCGIGADAFFIDIAITNDARGAPHVVLTHRAASRLAELTPHGYMPKIFLALSDELPYAVASVTIEAMTA